MRLLRSCIHLSPSDSHLCSCTKLPVPPSTPAPRKWEVFFCRAFASHLLKRFFCWCWGFFPPSNQGKKNPLEILSIFLSVLHWLPTLNSEEPWRGFVLLAWSRNDADEQQSGQEPSPGGAAPAPRAQLSPAPQRFQLGNGSTVPALTAALF